MQSYRQWKQTIMNWNRLRRSLRSRNRVASLRKDLLVERLEERRVLQGDPHFEPPVYFVPDSQSVIQGGILVFQNAIGNRFSTDAAATGSGNLQVTLSDPIVIDLVRDTSAPVLNAIEPASGSTQSVSRRKVTLQFSESLDPATVIPAHFQLQGPNEVVVPISVTLRQRDTRVEILYPPLDEVFLQDNIEVENTNASLPINGTSFWNLVSSTINGGTIQVNNAAQFTSGNGVLRDVIVNGNTRINSFGTLTLVGDLDFNGNVTNSGSFNATLQLGHESLYVGVPLIIRGGSFDLGANGDTATITGTNGPSSISLEPDAVLKGRRVDATFSRPLTNRGQIIADQQFSTSSGDLFHFTTTPITNQGTLSAINRAILRINNLAAPSSGIISSAVGSLVEFTGAFAQTAVGTTRIDIGGTASTQFGLVTAGGAASLAGNLNVQFASGFTPTVGNRVQVLNYASRTGQFDTINVTGLASGLVVTPEYNATNMTLVVSAAAAPAFARVQASPSSSGAPSNTAPTIEPIVAISSEARSLSITKMPALSYPDSTLFLSNDKPANPSRTHYDLSGKRQSTNDFWSIDDYSNAIDEVFKNLGDELLTEF
jgi:hypothetical protein